MSNQKGILSDVLIKNITDTLGNNEQVILLQNKKGLDRGGIQKIESILYKFFPKIKILRYDGDSIQKSKEYYNILNVFKEGNADSSKMNQVRTKIEECAENEKTKNMKQSLAAEEQAKQQFLEQWLRKIPDDPGRLLRNKMEREFQRRGKQRQQNEQYW